MNESTKEGGNLPSTILNKKTGIISDEKVDSSIFYVNKMIEENNKNVNKVVAHLSSRKSTIDYNLKLPIKLEEYNSSKHRKYYNGRNVCVIEKINGEGICFYYNGKSFSIKRKIGTDIVDNYCNIRETFNKHVDGFMNIKEKLNEVPFNIHAEINYYPQENKTEMVFFDLFLNDCWMDWDDLYELIIDNGFSAPKLLYRGMFADEKEIEELANNFTEGIVIRNLMEDGGFYRNITKITNKNFLKAKNNKKKEEEVADKCLKEFLINELKHKEIMYEYELCNRNIKKEVKNLSIIMKVISTLIMKDLELFLIKEFCCLFFDPKYVDDKMIRETTKKARKILPSIIRTILEI
ncbi:MAG TPA: RNA ligase family protein [Candidatus Paceibacterota bacterium]|nr:RNA ligase family protein [Candidatus Paceibacterota bacterium]